MTRIGAGPARRVLAVGLVTALALALVACSESGSDDAATTTTTTAASTTTTAPSPEWKAFDRDLAALGPQVGFLAARVAGDGSCEPVHAIDASTARPTGSQFKLFVLGALAEQVASGDVSWDQTLTIEDGAKSLGNGPGTGALQFEPAGTTVSVEDAASKMISISDNTAADMLIGLAGRDAVEAQVRKWTADAAANDPFLTTRQMLLLHYAKGLGDRYVATATDQRAAFLESSVDPLPIAEIASAFSTEPRFIDDIEWFASPDDICRAFGGLQALAERPQLSAQLPKILSHEVGGIGLDESEWPTVWFKGGSEPGVLTLGWLATNAAGEAYVVQAMVSNPDSALSDTSITDLVALGTRAFGIIGP